MTNVNSPACPKCDDGEDGSGWPLSCPECRPSVEPIAALNRMVRGLIARVSGKGTEDEQEIVESKPTDMSAP